MLCKSVMWCFTWCLLVWPERTPFFTSLDRRMVSVVPCWPDTHSQHITALICFRLHFKKNATLSVLAASENIIWSFCDQQMFMYFCREPRKRSGLKQRCQFLIYRDGHQHFRCSSFSESDHFLKSCSKISAGNFPYSGGLTFLHMLLHFLRVSTGNANHQWVLLSAAWEAEILREPFRSWVVFCQISGEIPPNMYLVMQLTYL